MVNITETESRIETTKDWGQGGNWELLFIGHRVAVQEDEKVLELDGGDGCTQYERT